MIVKVTVQREFIGGPLDSLIIEQNYTVDKVFAPQIGEKYQVHKPCGGSPYIDVVLKVEEEYIH